MAKEGREVRIEGRQSSSHTHSDGSHGHDIYAAQVVYDNGERVHESNAGFGHISVDAETGQQSDHVK